MGQHKKNLSVSIEKPSVEKASRKGQSDAQSVFMSAVRAIASNPTPMLPQRPRLWMPRRNEQYPRVRFERCLTFDQYQTGALLPRRNELRVRQVRQPFSSDIFVALQLSRSVEPPVLLAPDAAFGLRWDPVSVNRFH